MSTSGLLDPSSTAAPTPAIPTCSDVALLLGTDAVASGETGVRQESWSAGAHGHGRHAAVRGGDAARSSLCTLHARRFLTKAISGIQSEPAEVVTDRARAYLGVLEELLPAALHDVEQYANNPLEADHGRLKSRLRPMRG